MESEFKIQCVSDFLINHLRSFFTFQTRITERESWIKGVNVIPFY